MRPSSTGGLTTSAVRAWSAPASGQNNLVCSRRIQTQSTTKNFGSPSNLLDRTTSGFAGGASFSDATIQLQLATSNSDSV
eukprot:7396197-Pyramimonas_sp.AAC.1